MLLCKAVVFLFFIAVHYLIVFIYPFPQQWAFTLFPVFCYLYAAISILYGLNRGLELLGYIV